MEKWEKRDKKIKKKKYGMRVSGRRTGEVIANAIVKRAKKKALTKEKTAR